MHRRDCGGGILHSARRPSPGTGLASPPSRATAAHRSKHRAQWRAGSALWPGPHNTVPARQRWHRPERICVLSCKFPRSSRSPITAAPRSEAMTEERTVHVQVAPEDAGERLDRLLAKRIPELSRSRLKALILDGQVRSGERAIADPAFHVSAGETIAVGVPPPVAAEPQGENIPL